MENGKPVIDKDGKEKYSGNLEGEIWGLAEPNFLTFDNAKLLHELRFLGNAAAHELHSPTVSDLQLTIDVIEALIDNMHHSKYKGWLLEREGRKRDDINTEE